MSGVGWTVDELRQAVGASYCLTDAIRRLGLRPAGANYRSIRAWIDRLGISTDHFNLDRRRSHPRSVRALREILVERSTYPRGHLKERLYDEGLKHRACELCGQGEEWHGRAISLILDHVNGVADDNRLENLRIVCPNCAATLDTHCGRKLRLAARDCEACGKSYRPRAQAQRFCSRLCAVGAPRRHRGLPQPERRKVVRPSYDVLIAHVRSEGFLATGRRYGVSDNAIRKWILQYEREARAGESRVTIPVHRGSPAEAGRVTRECPPLARIVHEAA